jgi:tetratricopeptide (TPR) repeat protein
VDNQACKKRTPKWVQPLIRINNKKMKKYLSIALLLLLGIQLFAQRKSKTATPQPALSAQETNKHKAVYKQALQFGDASTAINSLYYIINAESGSSTYIDSLAILYFNVGMYAQCERVCSGLDANSTSIQQMIAYSQKALGKTLEAIGSFQKLSATTKNKVHAYELASLQLAVQRYLEFDNTISTAKDWQEGKESKIYIQTTHEKRQYVPVEAAFLHLQALKEANNKNYENAITLYKQTLSLFPEFELAQANVAVINKQLGTEQQKNIE